MLGFKHYVNSQTTEEYIETSLYGKLLLATPQLNKDTAFTQAERNEFQLLGKLPPQIETLEQQTTRAYQQFKSIAEPLKRNIYLHNIHSINQTLFYNLVSQHLAEMIPNIYTPMVGTAVQNFSLEYRRPRGLYITYQEQDNLEAILDNRSNPEIDLLVVTDGEGVLGIGDQGIGSIEIPIAKLMVYTLCGGIDPARTLPIYLDVGTDNETLLREPLYLGLREPRITGKQYDDFIDRFIDAVKKKFPTVLLHWEDFGRNNARCLLDRYSNQICTFNDDIQGTGVVALATILAAIQRKKETLNLQHIVIFGAGSAGTGIADQVRDAMLREGNSMAAANACFWLIDRHGLIHKGRADIGIITPSQKSYARDHADVKDWQVKDPYFISLADVITNVAATILIGCSAQSGAFSEAIIRTMATKVAQPIILPLSNPTDKAEATPDKLLEWTDGRALIATGSPFEPVNFHGMQKIISQCNNALVFPGLGLGILVVQAKRCTDNLLWAACQALSGFASMHKTSALLPGIDMARQVSKEIAIAVAKQAICDGLAQISMTELEVAAAVEKKMWQPRYLNYRKKA